MANLLKDTIIKNVKIAEDKKAILFITDKGDIISKLMVIVVPVVGLKI